MKKLIAMLMALVCALSVLSAYVSASAEDISVELVIYTSGTEILSCRTTGALTEKVYKGAVCELDLGKIFTQDGYVRSETTILGGVETLRLIRVVKAEEYVRGTWRDVDLLQAAEEITLEDRDVSRYAEGKEFRASTSVENWSSKDHEYAYRFSISSSDHYILVAWNRTSMRYTLLKKASGNGGKKQEKKEKKQEEQKQEEKKEEEQKQEEKKEEEQKQEEKKQEEQNQKEQQVNDNVDPEVVWEDQDSVNTDPEVIWEDSDTKSDETHDDSQAQTKVYDESWSELFNDSEDDASSPAEETKQEEKKEEPWSKEFNDSDEKNPGLVWDDQDEPKEEKDPGLVWDDQITQETTSKEDSWWSGFNDGDTTAAEIAPAQETSTSTTDDWWAGFNDDDDTATTKAASATVVAEEEIQADPGLAWE